MMVKVHGQGKWTGPVMMAVLCWIYLPLRSDHTYCLQLPSRVRVYPLEHRLQEQGRFPGNQTLYLSQNICLMPGWGDGKSFCLSATSVVGVRSAQSWGSSSGDLSSSCGIFWGLTEGLLSCISRKHPQRLPAAAPLHKLKLFRRELLLPTASSAGVHRSPWWLAHSCYRPLLSGCLSPTGWLATPAPDSSSAVSIAPVWLATPCSDGSLACPSALGGSPLLLWRHPSAVVHRPLGGSPLLLRRLLCDCIQHRGEGGLRTGLSESDSSLVFPPGKPRHSNLSAVLNWGLTDHFFVFQKAVGLRRHVRVFHKIKSGETLLQSCSPASSWVISPASGPPPPRPSPSEAWSWSQFQRIVSWEWWIWGIVHTFVNRAEIRAFFWRAPSPVCQGSAETIWEYLEEMLVWSSDAGVEVWIMVGKERMKGEDRCVRISLRFELLWRCVVFIVCVRHHGPGDGTLRHLHISTGSGGLLEAVAHGGKCLEWTLFVSNMKSSSSSDWLSTSGSNAAEFLCPQWIP